jgi:AcrR family transcriptional regulator
VRVIGRKGVDATTIGDITEDADVGFGTFYNYFDSKDAMLAAATTDAAGALGHALDRVNEHLRDPAEKLAVAVRHMVRMVDRDPIWASFVVRRSLYKEQIAAVHGPRLEHDLRSGIATGRFPETDVSLLKYAIGGAVFTVMQAKLAGVLDRDADSTLAAAVLRMVGMSAGEARDVARRPLPEIEVPVRDRRV